MDFRRTLRVWYLACKVVGSFSRWVRWVGKSFDQSQILSEIIAMDTPGGNLSLVKNIKGQTATLNRAIT